jgi:hypothetical protein
MSRLNPNIKKVEIGVKELKEITIYPLSLADEIELTDVISKGFSLLSDEDSGNDRKLVMVVMNFIVQNLPKVLEYITEEKPEEVLADITNDQAFEIALIVFQVNFERSIKNFKDLVEKSKVTEQTESTGS